MGNGLKFINSIIVVLTAIVSVSCSSERSKEKNILVFCAEGSPRLFSPMLATDGATFNASSRTVYSRLLDFKPGITGFAQINNITMRNINILVSYEKKMYKNYRLSHYLKYLFLTFIFIFKKNN